MIAFWEIWGIFAGLITTSGYIPQIIKTLKTKTIEGLSFLLLFISFIANIIALWYAVLIDQAPLQVKYVLAIVLLALCLGLYLRIFLQKTKE